MNETTETGLNRSGERKLVDRCRAGDVEAFGEVVEAYESRIRMVIIGVVRDRSVAEDICQEAFIRAFRSLDRFRFKSSLYTWIYRIAFNLALDHHRRHHRLRLVRLDEKVDPKVEPGAAGRSRDPSEPLVREETRRLVWKGLGRLSPSHRAILVMREWEGMDYRRIAEAMKCSPGTVMSRLFYARKKLKEVLSEIHETGY